MCTCFTAVYRPLNTVMIKRNDMRLIVSEKNEDTNNWESFPSEMNLGIFKNIS